MSDLKVTPTEADREAAADIWRALNNRHVVDEILSGRGDDGATVQAFARHRLQGWSECKEAAAKAAWDALYPTNPESDWTPYAADNADRAARVKAAITNLTPSTQES